MGGRGVIFPGSYRARELRPLETLRQATGAEQVDLVVLDPPLRRLDLPAGVRLIPAVEWLLEME